ncbi:arginyl-tRNA synthetase [Dacryopinax primogenitus]|uniref:arginine--tRNA ligase n=1 Tax=Dacryopinax primogenitus (strain DJM 731) TaxID=1858805 RepID=M5FWJ4_DACPD|nr:arginyl-tRNA synthetase [Dacryopinax primogenitus]EJU02311.1 arginyl-tRNA synthetase [Dacryopinax primogenitus]
MAATTSNGVQSAYSAYPAIPGVEPQICALDAFRLAVASKLAAPLGIPIEKAYEGIDIGKKEADFTVAIPRFRLSGKPDEWAKKVVDAFQPDDMVESAVQDKAFVSFMMRTPTLVRKVLDQINDLTYHTPSKKAEYGCNHSGKGKKVIIEYSSPNIAKEFHAGHLRSTIIGAFLSNVHRATGWDVTTINYLGDWGKQFGMVAVGFDRYGSEEALKTDAIHHLYDVYVKINRDGEKEGEEGKAVHDAAREFFKRMEDGDEAAVKQWKRFRDFSLERYKQSYERLNIEFDVYGGESTVSQKAMQDAVEKMQTMGLVETGEDGAKLVKLDKWKLGSTILQKKDGTSLYITRDIAGAIERYDKYHFDKMIYVVASQQDLHLAQFFKVLDLMGLPWAKTLEHVNFGMVAGMSSRKGTAVSLDHILNEAGEVMHEQMRKNEAKYANVENPEKTADEIGMSAVKIQDMAAKRINNYTFNWSRMLSFEGDTGPYLQYAHARLCSVQRRAADAGLTIPTDVSTVKTELLVEAGARAIVALLAAYPDVVRTALKTYEPSGVVTYLFKLSHAISGAWETLVVLGQEKELALARLWLFVCARDVLGTGLRLLSLRPLEKM